MTYLIDIAHPNALDDRRVVDEVRDRSDLAHALASPVFQWSPYDIVRVMTEDGLIVYVGFFTQSECVDIGRESDSMRLLDLRNVVASRYSSLIDLWQKLDPYNLTWAIRTIVDYRKLVSVAIRCATYSAMNLHVSFFEVLESNQFTEDNFVKNLREIVRNSRNPSSAIEDCARAILLVVNSLNSSDVDLISPSVDYSVFSVIKSHQISQKDAQVKIMNEIKSVLTFADILQGLAKQ